jgi:hypothetical protein
MNLNKKETEHLKELLNRVYIHGCEFGNCHECIFNYNYKACLRVSAINILTKIEEATNGKISNTP